MRRRDMLIGATAALAALAKVGANVAVIMPERLANTERLEAVTAPRDIARPRRMLEASGYNGERLVFLVATDIPALYAQGQVVAGAWKNIGLNVDMQALDWGTVIQRVASQQPTAYRKTLSGVLKGFPLFYNVRRA